MNCVKCQKIQQAASNKFNMIAKEDLIYGEIIRLITQLFTALTLFKMINFTDASLIKL